MNREAVLSGWGGSSRGNAKSAGTHDMPIPGMVTSRRQPRPKKKAAPAEPVFDPKVALREMRDEMRAQAAAAEQKKNRRRTERAARRRSRSRPRRRDESSGGASSSSSRSNRQADADTKVAWKERQEKEREEEEERVRKEADERWKAAQAEREARQKEEVRLAEERRKKDEQARNDRKKKLKGAFATGDSDDEDEEEKRKKEMKERQKVHARNEALNSSSLGAGPLQRPSDFGFSGGSESSGGQVDAISIRAQLADPSGSRNFSPGEVAEKYKLLQEMKRKFRRTEFGGGADGEKEKRRSRSRGRRSVSRSRYDSVWIKPSVR